jgi:hypothetical protein
MENTGNLMLLAPFIFGAVGLIALVFTFSKAGQVKPGRKAGLIMVSPSLLLVVIFYALAMHMYLSLGKWPYAIGTQGFSGALTVHAEVTMVCFYVLFMLTVFVWPVLFFLSILCGWRPFANYLGIHALSFAVCFGAMLLAPEPFLNWWWD